MASLHSRAGQSGPSATSTVVEEPRLIIPGALAALLLPVGLDVVSIVDWEAPTVHDLEIAFSNDAPQRFGPADVGKIILVSGVAATNLATELEAALAAGAQSIRLGLHRYPLWVLSYWLAVWDEVVPSSEAWATALEWLRARPASRLRSRLLDERLPRLKWDCTVWVATERWRVEAVQLARFLSRRWLSGDSQDLMLDLMRVDIGPALDERYVLLDHYRVAALMKLYNEREVNTSEAVKARRRNAEWMAKEVGLRDLAGFYNIKQQHWVSFVTGRQAFCLLYGESTVPMKVPPGQKFQVCSALKRMVEWLMKAVPHPSVEQREGVLVKRIKCSYQNLDQDSVSCGLLAADGLHQQLGARCDPEKPRLLIGETAAERDTARMECLDRVLEIHEGKQAVFSPARSTSKIAEKSKTTAAGEKPKTNVAAVEPAVAAADPKPKGRPQPKPKTKPTAPVKTSGRGKAKAKEEAAEPTEPAEGAVKGKARARADAKPKKTDVEGKGKGKAGGKRVTGRGRARAAEKDSSSEDEEWRDSGTDGDDSESKTKTDVEGKGNGKAGGKRVTGRGRARAAEKDSSSEDEEWRDSGTDGDDSESKTKMKKGKAKVKSGAGPGDDRGQARAGEGGVGTSRAAGEGAGLNAAAVTEICTTWRTEGLRPMWDREDKEALAAMTAVKARGEELIMQIAEAQKREREGAAAAAVEEGALVAELERLDLKLGQVRGRVERARDGRGERGGDAQGW
ncbi:hypothetical protein DFH09DRAFT_1416451 [Mycena vulgaris]|nr:hypothetical protein DFH09DRAFT_1416451 [Mycena vulgaris]